MAWQNKNNMATFYWMSYVTLNIKYGLKGC